MEEKKNQTETENHFYEDLTKNDGWEFVEQQGKTKTKEENLELKRKKQQLAEQQKKDLELKKKKKKRRICLGSVLVVLACFAIVISVKYVIPSAKYKEANLLLENGSYHQAIEAFQEINGFRDSQEKIVIASKELIKSGKFEKRDTILIGEYEWLVLEKEEHKAVLITKEVIDSLPFDNNNSNIWEDSSLRSYLNETFYQQIDKDIQNMIIETQVETEGRETNDFVYLLSIDEAESYFSDNEARMTSYQDQGSYWLLRNNNLQFSDGVACVQTDGNQFWTNACSKCGIRPVIQITF